MTFKFFFLLTLNYVFLVVWHFCSSALRMNRFFKPCEEKENEEEEEKRRGVVRDAAFGAGGRDNKFIALGS